MASEASLSGAGAPHVRNSNSDLQLSPEDDERICRWLQYMEAINYPKNQRKFALVAQELSRSSFSGRKVFRTGSIPGRGWLWAFQRRHPTLFQYSANKSSIPKLGVTRQHIQEWFAGLVEHLASEDLDPSEFLQPTNGHRIYNCDEFGVLSLEDGTFEVEFVRKCDKSMRRCQTEKMVNSAVVCISAAGDYVKPFILSTSPWNSVNQCIKEKRINPGTFSMIFTDRGWMDQLVFMKWLDVFVKHISGLERPVLVLLHGYPPHISLSAMDTAKRHRIIFHCLPPHSSSALQPIDVAVLQKLSDEFGRSAESHAKAYEGKVPIECFPALFMKAWGKSTDLSNAVTGFTITGIVPMNPEVNRNYDVVKFSKLKSPTLFPKPNENDAHDAPSGEFAQGFAAALNMVVSDVVSESVKPLYLEWLERNMKNAPDRGDDLTVRLDNRRYGTRTSLQFSYKNGKEPVELALEPSCSTGTLGDEQDREPLLKEEFLHGDYDFSSPCFEVPCDILEKELGMCNKEEPSSDISGLGNCDILEMETENDCNSVESSKKKIKTE